MKNILILLPFIIFFQDAFFTKVLNDNSRHSAFLAFPVKSKNYSGTVVTENYYLYRYYKEKHGWKINDYANFLGDKLAANDTILLDDKYFKSGHCFFTSVIELDSKLSINEIVNLYFEPGGIRVMKSGIAFSERNNIIRKLFENKIGCRTDGETGLVVLIK